MTGEGAIAAVDAQAAQLQAVCEALKANTASVVDKVTALRSEARELEKEVARLKQKLATSAGGDLTGRAVAVGDTQVLAVNVDGADAKTLRETMDQCKNKLGSGVVFLAAVNDDKVALTCGVTADLTDRIRAGDVMREFAGRLGGKGGGRPDMAQGGGTDVAALDDVLRAIPAWVGERMGVSA